MSLNNATRDNRLDRVIKELRKIDESIAELPLNLKPSWERRAYKEFQEITANPFIQKKLKKFPYGVNRLFDITFGLSLYTEYSVSPTAVKMITKYRKVGDPFAPGFCAPLSYCNVKYRAVLPSRNPGKAYKQLLNGDDIKLKWFLFPTYGLLGEIRQSDFKDFYRLYMPVLTELHTDEFNGRKRVRGLDHLKTFEKVVSLHLEGKSIPEICRETAIDAKTIGSLIKRAKTYSTLAREEFELGTYTMAVDGTDYEVEFNIQADI